MLRSRWGRNPAFHREVVGVLRSAETTTDLAIILPMLQTNGTFAVVCGSSQTCISLLCRYQLQLRTASVCPTHYTLRHGYDGYGSSHYRLRNWLFQGSNDGASWTTLSTHVNDAKLPAAGYSSATWPVTPQTGFYTYFRVSQTGANSSGANHLMMSGFEVYGRVRLNS